MSTGDVTLSIRLDLPGGGRIGPGKVALMRALREAGSLRRAAEALGMSYRRVWKLTEELNTAAGFTVVEKAAGGEGGGGARLSERGAELLSACERVILAAEKATEAERANVKALAAP
ncbi:winged helix-turn-helix domain-containing protein [Parvularcula maris]|uniref:LysR family transcriptional regulator n=1 Tax=Parvularcula maris TaxID=2965077 RepID=A0A9X2L870_9PROT|nr:LysR family transcriptional regulator [Parvularcula maris]MCQ8184866.1 LysR family transcriptional regulator [Parvularcula maris]